MSLAHLSRNRKPRAAASIGNQRAATRRWYFTRAPCFAQRSSHRVFSHILVEREANLYTLGG